MDFMQEYEKWLHSPALSPEEHAELESIKDDPLSLIHISEPTRPY